MSRPRLDVLLADRGLVGSKSQAQVLILAGKVRVDGETIREPSREVRGDQTLEVLQPSPYASRGGQKLAPALDRFGVNPADRICADIGASTGGFTDVLLQRGATRVFAVDVGRGLIHEKLRQDPRVVLMERVNARDLDGFPEPVSLITVDVSFIGVEKVIPALVRAAPGAELVILFKPQFQVERSAVGRGGIVSDPFAVERALAMFREFCAGVGLDVAGEAPSSIAGADGNQEFLLHLRRTPG